MTGNELTDRYLAEYEERNKRSSASAARYQLGPFRRVFGDRSVRSITRAEAKDFFREHPRAVPQTSAMFSWAISEEEIGGLARNPFRGLTSAAWAASGRSQTDPPTLEQMQALRAACDVLGDELGPRVRDLLDFAALTLMRPGELYELRWSDVDLELNRIRVSRRLYGRDVDVPKNGAPKTIALVPPARAILLRQPTWNPLDGALVFVSQTGSRLSAQTLSRYWQRVTARAGLDCDFYLASKHFGVSRLYRLGLSERAIAAQAGWSVKSVEAMLDVYGHRTNTALDEVAALYACDAEQDAEPSKSPGESGL